MGESSWAPIFGKKNPENTEVFPREFLGGLKTRRGLSPVSIAEPREREAAGPPKGNDSVVSLGS